MVKQGWRSAERHLDGALLDPVIDRAVELGFELTTRDPGHSVLVRKGRHFAVRAADVPQELTVSESEDGVRLGLRYLTFAAFDTGDLERLLDGYVRELAADGS